MSDVWDSVEGGGEYAETETWRPEEVGASISGTVTRIDPNVSTKYGNRAVVEITKDDQSLWTVWVSQVSLIAAMKKERPQVGDRIAISFTGTEPSDKGNDRKLFDVAVKRGGDEPAAAGNVSAADLL